MGRVKSFFMDMIESKMNGNPKGIVSICSTNPYVLRSYFKRASNGEEKLLIESTSNQVNQYGGYTGMTPGDFKNYVVSIAHEYGIDENRIILGGDHLGPNPFKKQKNTEAMEQACKLVEECVKAGYKKIHLDASMLLHGDTPDSSGGLPKEIAAERAATLCKAAEEAIGYPTVNSNADGGIVYIIGTEVPAPGGSDEVEDRIEITTPENLNLTIELTKKAFYKRGLKDAWERVVGVVCQPGVEFGNLHIVDYDRQRAKDLVNYLNKVDFLVGEAHSTDYQKRKNLKALVEDGFSILKVGPALTFALREALFALSFIEDEIISDESEKSSLVSVLERVMLQKPEWWKDHYKGDYDKNYNQSLRLSFRYSLFDRIRYYWNEPEVIQSIKVLFNNLRRREIPYSLLSQFLPEQYWRIRNHDLVMDPLEIILDKINEVIQDYMYATASD